MSTCGRSWIRPSSRNTAPRSSRTASLQHDEVTQFLAAAGIDPPKDIASLTLADTGTTSAQFLARRSRSFDLAKVHAALERLAKTHPDAVAIHPQRQHLDLEGKNKGKGKPLFGAFAAADTLVVSPSRDYVAQRAVKG